VVVNEAFLGALGVPDLSTRPTVVIGGTRPVRAAIVGVVREGYGEELLAYRVDRSAGPWDEPVPGDPATMVYGPTTLELWVPPEQADEVMAVVSNDLGLALGGVQVDAYRQDAQGLEDDHADASERTEAHAQHGREGRCEAGQTLCRGGIHCEKLTEQKARRLLTVKLIENCL